MFRYLWQDEIARIAFETFTRDYPEITECCLPKARTRDVKKRKQMIETRSGVARQTILWFTYDEYDEMSPLREAIYDVDLSTLTATLVDLGDGDPTE